jgi:hypothetical protein
MKVAALLVAVVLAGGVLWLAGEEHRRNCIASGRVECSVLPWDAGERPSESSRRGTLTEQGCQQLLIDNALALTEEEQQEIPPECRD